MVMIRSHNHRIACELGRNHVPYSDHTVWHCCMASRKIHGENHQGYNSFARIVTFSSRPLICKILCAIICQWIQLFVWESSPWHWAISSHDLKQSREAATIKAPCREGFRRQRKTWPEFSKGKINPPVHVTLPKGIPIVAPQCAPLETGDHRKKNLAKL